MLGWLYIPLCLCMSEKPNNPQKQVKDLVEKAIGTVEGALGEPMPFEGGVITSPTRPLNRPEHEALSKTMHAIQIALFAERVAESDGKTLTHTIPLMEDGTINRSEAERALYKTGQLGSDLEKGGKSLIEYLRYVNSNTPANSDSFSVENLKETAALVSKNHPEVTIEFTEGPSSITYTARFG